MTDPKPQLFVDRLHRRWLRYPDGRQLPYTAIDRETPAMARRQRQRAIDPIEQKFLDAVNSSDF